MSLTKSLLILHLRRRNAAEALTAAERFALLDECREKKESLNPNSRKVLIDLERVREGWKEVSVGADVFYDRCRPLIEQSRPW